MGIFLCLKKKEGNGAGELSVFCQSYFNKMLIGQAGSIGGKARQEVGVEQRAWEYSGKTGSFLSDSCADHRRDNMYPAQLRKVRSHALK